MRNCIGGRVRTHGMSGTKLHNTWKNMRQRCANPKVPHYPRYGGSGIKVCPEWIDNFEPFMEWALANGYDDSLSIDRIESDKDYRPDNCQWIPLQDNVDRMIEDHYLNGTGLFSQECFDKVKVTNRKRLGKKVVAMKDKPHVYFDSIGEAAEYFAKELNRTELSCKKQIQQVLRPTSRCKTLAGWEFKEWK